MPHKLVPPLSAISRCVDLIKKQLFIACRFNVTLSFFNTLPGLPYIALALNSEDDLL
jgi:hypothetical protein